MPDGSSSKLFAPSTSARILSNGRPKKTSPPMQHYEIKIKTAGGHTAARLERTNLGIVRHPEVSATTCAMRVFPRSQAQSLPPRFQRSAHKESMTILIYHNILCLSIQNFFYLVFLLKCSEPSVVRQIANTHNGRITGVLKEAIHSKGVFSPYCKRIDIFVFAKRREENSYLSA